MCGWLSSKVNMPVCSKLGVCVDGCVGGCVCVGGQVGRCICLYVVSCVGGCVCG